MDGGLGVDDISLLVWFAYVGRGVMRPEFVDAGVYGSELLVIDLRTAEVMGLTRNYYLVRPASNTLGQLSKEAVTRSCPNAPRIRSSKEFVATVLQG